MAFGRMKRRKSDADHKRAVNAALNFLGVPIQNDVKPKRAYTKRSDGSEHQEQSTVVEWWDAACKGYGLPHFALFAVPNGAFFGSGYATAAKLKKEGMRKGILDLVLAVPRDQFHGLFIEMKYGSNTPSPEQWKVKDYLEKSGYCVGIHWTADAAIQQIKDYLQ